NVGYLALRTSFNITTNESFCLNFHYYGYGQGYTSHLKVFAWLSDSVETIQTLWPLIYGQIYTRNKWTWAIVNLPIGYYSFLFRVDNTDSYPSSFAIDNISIISCDYPPSTFSNTDGLLSFSCNFDNLTMCVMKNEDQYPLPTYNFTLFTGKTVPDRVLSPHRDHTNNSTTGGFIYWDRHLPFISEDFGDVHSSKPVEVNLGMCIQFAYYVKSSIDNKNGSTIDDSYGWQVVMLPIPNAVCMETFYFQIYQQQTVSVSVAFDDIEVGQCNIISPTTTTTSTSTIITTTMTTATSSTSIQIITSSSSLSTPLTLSTSTSTQSNARRLLVSNRRCNLSNVENWKMYWGDDFEAPYDNNNKKVVYNDVPNTAYHGYWARDFKRPEEHFGTWADFDA
ncbi:unnamed protein product, partial [Rotaria sp. Silwood1]